MQEVAAAIANGGANMVTVTHRHGLVPVMAND